MKVKIKPSRLSGAVGAPASKSMAHRLLICAGLCDGESVIENVAYSEDILATLDCLSTLGAKISKDGSRVTVSGVNPALFDGGVFECRESGSTLRFFIPLALFSGNKSIFRGSGRLMERPLEIYESIAEERGFTFERWQDGITVSGKLEGGVFTVRGDISSQFITGLLFALPLCKNDSTVILTGKAESLSYLNLTVSALEKFGVIIEKNPDNSFFIKGNQKYTPANLAVEGDCSNAAFLDAFNLMGSDVEVEGLDENTLQGDRVYKALFSELKKGTPILDVSDCPDLAPILMTLAAAFNGARLIGTRRLKIKESDRAEVMKQELSKFGAEISCFENEVEVRKMLLHKPVVTLCGHNDHRVVMSLAVLSSVYGGIIEGADAVKKSFPDFFEKVKQLGLEVILNGD